MSTSTSEAGDAAEPSPRHDGPVGKQAIAAQLAQLNQALPGFVLKVGELTTPACACVDGEVVFPVPNGGEDGPWTVDVTMRGPDDGAYSAPFRVRLEFNAAYPMFPPEVTILSVMRHMHLDDTQQPPALFYQLLRQDHRLPHVLQQVYQFVAGPLHPCENCNRQWAVVSAANHERLDVMREYEPMQRHPALFAGHWQEKWLAPELVAAVEQGTASALEALLTRHAEGVFSFPLFTHAFCDELLQEVEHYADSGLPIRRPNSMNNYGLIVNEIGLEATIDSLQAHWLQPIARHLFGEVGVQLDRHHSFIVAYQVDQDRGLDMHTDDSDVTFNVCLGKDFDGAGLQFCGTMGQPHHRRHSLVYRHVKGHCVVHLGRTRHGADDITRGERRNLIIWNHSLQYRKSTAYQQPPYEKESAPPDAVCVSFTHDRDYGQFKQYTAKTEEFRLRGWCPPPKMEYDGFVSDRSLKASQQQPDDS